MDYISLVSVLTMTIDATAELAQLATMTTSNAVESTTCYRQGAFSFGRCDMTTSADQKPLGEAWLIANLIFAFIFFNTRIKRGWKVLAFLVGIPGTLFIAVFLQLFGARWKRKTQLKS